MIVVYERMLGCDFILGMSGILAAGGVQNVASNNVNFMAIEVKAGACIEAEAVAGSIVEEKGFSAEFDATNKRWIARWRWAEKPVLKSRLSQYIVGDAIRDEFEAEVR